MKVIGLTGSMASGKSTVAKILEQSNIPVIDADNLARQVVKKNSPTLTMIAKVFSNAIISKDGNLDREKLSNLVFNNPESLVRLENIIHPEIEKMRQKILQDLKEKNVTLAVYMAPLLFEKSLQETMDGTILISSSQEKLIERAMKRSGLSRESVLQRLEKQMSDEKKRELADIVVENEGSLEELKKNFCHAFQRLTGISLRT